MSENHEENSDNQEQNQENHEENSDNQEQNQENHEENSDNQEQNQENRKYDLLTINKENKLEKQEEKIAISKAKIEKWSLSNQLTELQLNRYSKITVFVSGGVCLALGIGKFVIPNLPYDYLSAQALIGTGAALLGSTKIKTPKI